jgi:hypothetical protein
MRCDARQRFVLGKGGPLAARVALDFKSAELDVSRVRLTAAIAAVAEQLSVLEKVRLRDGRLGGLLGV